MFIVRANRKLLGASAVVILILGSAAFIRQGTDPLKIMTEFCRKNRIEIFWSMRMNDTHDASSSWYGPVMMSRLKKAHPEWLESSKASRSRHGAWSAMDYTHAEVRDLAVRYIEEVCANYDVDGIEMDFMRHPVVLKDPAWGRDATTDGLAMITD